jgi:hypothetical protein
VSIGACHPHYSPIGIAHTTHTHIYIYIYIIHRTRMVENEKPLIPNQQKSSSNTTTANNNNTTTTTTTTSTTATAVAMTSTTCSISYFLNPSYHRRLKPKKKKNNSNNNNNNNNYDSQQQQLESHYHQKNASSNHTLHHLSSEKWLTPRQQENRWGAMGIFDMKQAQKSTFHLILVGNALVGKKTLCTKLTGMGSVQKSGNYRFVKWNGNRLAQINIAAILDLDNSYTMTQMGEYLFEGDVDAILLCFRLDNHESFDALEEKLAEKLAEKASHVPLFLIGTRADVPIHQREVSFNEAITLCERIPNCLGYFETSIIESGPRMSVFIRKTLMDDNDDDNEDDGDEIEIADEYIRNGQRTDGDDDDDDDDDEIIEAKSSGTDLVMYHICKELYFRKWGRKLRGNKDKFEMKYVDLSGYEYAPFILQLDSPIDRYSTMVSTSMHSDSMHSMSQDSYTNNLLLKRSDTLEQLEAINLGQSKLSKFALYFLCSLCGCSGSNGHILE